VVVKEDLSAEIHVPNRGTMSLEELSGGQQVAFALALRFALSENFNQKMELLILDEPTVHLDQTRRTALTELIKSLKGKLSQVIVITHDPEIESAADSLVKVEMVNGYSQVELQ